MINRYYKILLFLVMGILAAGCTEDMPDVPARLLPDAPGTVTIRFACSGMTRSTDSDNSEAHIGNLLVGLYVSGPSEDVKPVAEKDVKAEELVPDAEGRITVSMRLTDEMVERLFGDKSVSGAQCRLYAIANRPMDEDAPRLPEKPTIAQMNALSVTSPFKTRQVQDSFVMVGEGTVTYTAPTGSEIYGKASGEGLLCRAAAKIRLNVSLPARIEVPAKDADGNDITETWVPETTDESMSVLLNNGVQTAVAYPVGSPAWRPADSGAYYDSDLKDGESYRVLKNTGSGEYPYTMEVPFYTYPNAWEELETSQTTLTLRVRWGKPGPDGSAPTAWQTYYYQVPVTPNEIQRIDRNYSYTVNLKVGMLGSTVPQTSQVVDGLSYQIVNWQTENVVVDMNDYRYLVVNPNIFSVQNENTVNIPYYSSHEVEVENITMTFQRFNFFSDGTGDIVEFVVPQTILDRSVSDTGDKMVSYEKLTSSTNQKYLRITHPMVIWTPVNGSGTEVQLTGVEKPNNYNDMTEAQKATYMSDFVSNNIYKFIPPTDAADAVPFSSYTFHITICHKDKPNYKEDIVITQYPGMYITAEKNGATGSGNSAPLRANVYINNRHVTGAGDNAWWGITTNWTATNSNANPNMYTVTISQLSDSEGYIIGDPRMLYPSNQLDATGALETTTQNSNNPAATAAGTNITANNWCVRASALYNSGTATTRTLTYYYPTIEETTDEYKMRVAPKFRIASSYGKCPAGNYTRTNSRRRAATYQEMGYPAGRWRLPTYGELLFIIRLSNTGKIPTLFNDNGKYWTAQGLYTINGTELDVSDATTGYVRAVYDEWYWEQYANEGYEKYSVLTPTNGTYAYTLGDIPRGAIIGK